MNRKNLKKLIGAVLVCALSFSMVACSNNSNTATKPEEKPLTKVRLNEVVRSVFYAPMYVAINNGYFKEEGIDIDLATGQGADKTMQQLLSNNADIGFSGPEQIIYIYNQGREDLPVVFAQLTQKDGSFLVAKEKPTNFKWEDVTGKSIIGARPGGVPEMSLEQALKNHGIEKGKNVEIVTNISFTATSGAFKSGAQDYVALFEPTASMLEKDNGGYIAASIGKEVGNLPYTCFYSTKSYMEKNPEIIQGFTNAIYKGQQWVKEHSDEEVAKAIESFFPGTDHDIIVRVMKNYRDIEAIATSPVVKEEDMNRLMKLIEGYDAKLIAKKPAFKDIVTNDFAEKAVSGK